MSEASDPVTHAPPPERRIIVAEFDPREFALVITRADGEVVKFDLLRHSEGWLNAEEFKRLQICECGAMVMFLDGGGYYHETHQASPSDD